MPGFAAEQEASKIPLLVAVGNGDLTEVRRLISHGSKANVRAPGGSKTPLHLAVELHLSSIAKELILAQADVNAKTRNGTTPLHVAAQEGYVELIDMLAAAGAVIDVFSGIGCTPLHEAAANGQKEAVLKLLALGADPSVKDTRFQLKASDLAQIKGHGTIRDILVAALTQQSGFIPVPNAMPARTEKQKVINVETHNQQTPVLPTFEKMNREPKRKQILKRYQLDRDTALPTPETALRRAAAVGATEDVAHLCQWVTNLNATDDNPSLRRTALHWAAFNKHIAVIELLKSKGAKADLPDATGKTANDYTVTLHSMTQALSISDIQEKRPKYTT